MKTMAPTAEQKDIKLTVLKCYDISQCTLSYTSGNSKGDKKSDFP